MPTVQQVRELLDAGHSYEAIGRELHVSPGLAFMIATGRPADGPRQELIGPPSFNPNRNARVDEWVRRRAAEELTGG